MRNTNSFIEKSIESYQSKVLTKLSCEMFSSRKSCTSVRNSFISHFIFRHFKFSVNVIIRFPNKLLWSAPLYCYLFFFLIEVNDKWFSWKLFFKELIFHIEVLSALSYLGVLMTKSYKAPDSTLWVYSIHYSPTRFSFRDNYKCPLWNLPLRSLRPSNSLKNGFNFILLFI